MVIALPMFLLIGWLICECYFNCYEMSDRHKFKFGRRRLVKHAQNFWISLEIARETRNGNPTDSW